MQTTLNTAWGARAWVDAKHPWALRRDRSIEVKTSIAPLGTQILVNQTHAHAPGTFSA
jgi:hypothetical protein